VWAAWTSSSRGLAEAVLPWKECNDPLPYLERRAYQGAIQDALPGVEEARVVLAKPGSGWSGTADPGLLDVRNV
jgi:hypothetical protein